MIDSRVVCIVGKGAWGSALAYIFAKAGLKVNLISASGSKNNNLTLPPSNENIITQFSNRKAELEAALSKSSLVFLAPSSKYLKKVSYEIAPYVTKQPVISLTKGIDPLTGQTMSEILEKIFEKVGVLSGGSHAEEVIRGLPFNLTLAIKCNDHEFLSRVLTCFASTNARIEITNDCKGVELAAALKNIVAITIGISDALELGDNFRSTLIVKGLSEIANLGSALGCERSTFYGNAGLGDLIATSLSKYSRNRQFGYLLGKGHSREEAETKIGAVVEGIHALRGTFVLTSRARLSSPYFDVIYQIIQGRLSPEEVIKI